MSSCISPSTTSTTTTKVYLGEHKGTLVAVKMIQGINASVAAEFAQEAGVLSSLNHPNILGFVGVCVLDQRRRSMHKLAEKGSLPQTEVAGGSLALVIEYCENGTLTELLHKKERGRNGQTGRTIGPGDTPLSDDQKRLILLGIASGLE